MEEMIKYSDINYATCIIAGFTKYRKKSLASVSEQAMISMGLIPDNGYVEHKKGTFLYKNPIMPKIYRQIRCLEYKRWNESSQFSNDDRELLDELFEVLN